MLRITPNTSEAGAKAYYTEGLSRPDYYVKGQEAVGRWGGKAAEHLGLSGAVSREQFFALCENRHPETGTRLTARTNDKRRVGYDFTFNAPKSLSVLYAMHQDPRLLAAFRESVQATMTELEGEVRTRVRKGGENRDRVTGNMVWAEFVHFTARPVDGVPDPHLHVHCFAMNATFDAAEGRFKAAEFGGIKRDASYFEAAFHARLAKAVARQGYAIRATREGWELAHVPDGLVEAFSRRTRVIEDKARALGITDAKEKAELGARTRERKREALGDAELRSLWEARLSAEDRHALGQTAAKALPAHEVRITANESVQHALSHCFETKSVVPEKELLAEALWHGIGTAGVSETKAALARAGAIRRELDGRVLFTTRDVLAEEARMVEFARDGRGRFLRLAPECGIEPAFLNEGQRAAIRLVWESHDRVMIIRGGAGTGKTTLMREAIRGLEQSGHKVVTLAPTAEAARTVLRAEGFHSADTVARFLKDNEFQESARGGVLWVDEAGLLGTRTMGQLLERARELGARVVLSGDTRQHRSVERGDALRLLETEAGLIPAEVMEIQRQQGSYKKAVTALAHGDMAKGFAMLERMGAVIEDDAAQGHARLARDYADLSGKGKQVLVVSPTHREGREVTEAIRGELKARGRLGEEREFKTLVSERMTEAERRHPQAYRAGQVVVFHQNAKSYRRGESISVHRIHGKPLATVEVPPRGIKKHDRLTVLGTDGRTVRVADDRGNERMLPLGEAAKFDVFRTETVSVAGGDRVRFTRNMKTACGRHELKNGAIFVVAGFAPDGALTLANGWTVSRDHGHMAHGYATTSHASQGKTVDAVFVAERAASLAAASAEQFYVSVSRAKRDVRIYTDDREALLDAIRERQVRMAGLELVKHRLQPVVGDRWQRLKHHAESLMQRGRALGGMMVQKVQDLLPNSGKIR